MSSTSARKRNQNRQKGTQPSKKKNRKDLTIEEYFEGNYREISNFSRNGFSTNPGKKEFQLSKVLKALDKTRREMRDKAINKDSDHMVAQLLNIERSGVEHSQLEEIIAPENPPPQENTLFYNNGYDMKTLMQAALEPISIAVSQNLPICRSNTLVNGVKVGTLQAAYAASILDWITVLRGQTSILKEDLEVVMWNKRAHMPTELTKKDDFVDRNQSYSWDIEGTWLELVPEVPNWWAEYGYSIGVDIHVANNFNQVNQTPLIVDEEYVLSDCIPAYMLLIHQLKEQGLNTLTFKDNTIYDKDISAFAIPRVKHANPNAVFNNRGQIFHTTPIPPRSRWIASMGMSVFDGAKGHEYLDAQYTSIIGTCHFANAITERRNTKVFPLIQCTSIYVEGCKTQMILSAIQADMRQTEVTVQNGVIIQSSSSIFNSVSSKELSAYIANLLLERMAQQTNICKFMLPEGTYALTGMKFLPNTTFQTAMAPAYLSERLKLLFPSTIETTKKGVLVKRIPALVCDGQWSTNLDASSSSTSLLDYFQFIQPISMNSSTYQMSFDGRIDPLSNTCYTRGPIIKQMRRNGMSFWAFLQDSVICASYTDKSEANFNGITRLIIRDGTSEFSGYHKFVVRRVCSDLPFTRISTSHDALGILPCAIMGSNLFLSEEDIYTRCKVYQQYSGQWNSQDYRDPHDEEEELVLLIDTDATVADYYIIQKFSDPRSNENMALEVVLMRGDGGNAFLWIKRKAGGLLKKVSKIGGELSELFKPGSRDRTYNFLQSTGEFLDPSSLSQFHTTHFDTHRYLEYQSQPIKQVD